MNLILCALDFQVYSAFKKYFANEKDVSVYCDDFWDVAIQVERGLQA